MRGMRPSAPTPSGRRRLSNHRRPTPPAVGGLRPPLCAEGALLGAGGEPSPRHRSRDCPATAAPLRPPLAGSGPLRPAASGGGRRAPRTATEQDRCRRRLASGQSPPGVGVKGMRPPAYAGFKKRRPPSASLRSLSGGGAIAPTPPERPPFSGGRPPGSPLPGWGSRGCGLAFAPAAQPPTAQARYADARPRLRSPLNVVSVRTTALPARSRTRRPAPVRLGSFRFRPSARSPSLASGCLALGNARKLADLGRRCLQKRSGSEIRAD